MFIETLEFTIPVDLCEVFTTLKNGPKSNVEFPASVNSYGTTQDASILVALRANKLTLKVDGVSSNASMVSKSECKTLKLSVFDVDQSTLQLPTECSNFNQSNVQSPSLKRGFSSISPMLPPSAKSRRTSLSDHGHSPTQNTASHSYSTPRPDQSQNLPSDNIVMKIEPEDLIEIDPDPEPQTKDEDHNNSPNPLRPELPGSIDSQTHLYSTTKSFHNVSDYSEASTSRRRSTDQNSEHDFPYYQQEHDDDDDNEQAAFSNDGIGECSDTNVKGGEEETSVEGYQQDILVGLPSLGGTDMAGWGQRWQEGDVSVAAVGPGRAWPCQVCGKVFKYSHHRTRHMASVHERVTVSCACGKVYRSRDALRKHQKFCAMSAL